MSTIRQVAEGLQYQGSNEQIVYSLTTTNWGSSPSAVAVTVHDEETNVTTAVTTGSATATGDVITLPIIKSLTAGRTYRVAVKFGAGGQLFESYFEIKAEP